MNNKIKLFETSIYNKENYKEYCKLKLDENITSINKKDLPDELTDELCQFISDFRRKTVNEENEWNLYIDYEKNEVIHCFKGQKTNVTGWINLKEMENRKILSIHNHPKGTFSAPSSNNFEILDHEFENYEVICAEEEYWILEAKGKYKLRKNIQDEVSRAFESIKNSKQKDKNKKYSKILTTYINNLNIDIKITKRAYKK